MLAFEVMMMGFQMVLLIILDVTFVTSLTWVKMECGFIIIQLHEFMIHAK